MELVRLQTYWTWGDHDNLESIITPRCLCSSTIRIATLEEGKQSGREGGDGEMYIAAVLSTFSCNFQSCIQVITFPMLSCMASCSRIGQALEQSRAVSSAKRLTPGAISGRSLIYRRNSSGPRIEPWGTPEVTGKGSDNTVERRTS